MKIFDAKGRHGCRTPGDGSRSTRPRLWRDSPSRAPATSRRRRLWFAWPPTRGPGRTRCRCSTPAAITPMGSSCTGRGSMASSFAADLGATPSGGARARIRRVHPAAVHQMGRRLAGTVAHIFDVKRNSISGAGHEHAAASALTQIGRGRKHGCEACARSSPRVARTRPHARSRGRSTKLLATRRAQLPYGGLQRPSESCQILSLRPTNDVVVAAAAFRIKCPVTRITDKAIEIRRCGEWCWDATKLSPQESH